MKIDCPHCGVHGSVEDSLAGKKLRCPKCSKVFLIPEELLPAIDDVGLLHQKIVSDEQPESPGTDVLLDSSEAETVLETESDDASVEDELDAEVDDEEKELSFEASEQEDSEEGLEILDEGDAEDSQEEETEAAEEILVDDVEGIELTETESTSTQAFMNEEDEVDDESILEKSCSECGEKFHPDFLQDVDGKLFCGVCQPEVLDVASSEGEEAVISPVASMTGRDMEAAGEDEFDTELEGDLQGSDFTIGEVLKEAWRKTMGAKGAIWGGLIVMYLILFGIGFVTVYGLKGVYVSSDPSTALGTSTSMGINVGLQLFSSWLSAIFTAGIMWIGVKRALHQPVSWNMVFAGFSKVVSITMTVILQAILVIIGFCLLVVPGIYLSVGYVLALPLIMEKDYGPWEALEASRKAIHEKWWTVFGVYLVMILIYLVAAIPLGLGLIWAIPMSFLCVGVLYRRLLVSSEQEDEEDAEIADAVE